ncbi:hypothetical protein K1T71_004299 [Dendrolimus kikuchii]|uniref:Uncharacterized protein n=1 Tax=Dendrolimus kikuchii TaxID=765133 RepID=A0ACC1D716_9NEOP|nr:hypothetical protein K1T71_004299 [Dendrolimus kikuchii]
MKWNWVSWQALLVTIVLVIVVADFEVYAAPEPCAFWDHHHYHYQETTTVSSTTQAAEEPKQNEEKEQTDKKENRRARFKKLEKMIADWMSWGQTWEMQEPQNDNYMEGFFKGYLEILAYLLNLF